MLSHGHQHGSGPHRIVVGPCAVYDMLSHDRYIGSFGPSCALLHLREHIISAYEELRCYIVKTCFSVTFGKIVIPIVLIFVIIKLGVPERKWSRLLI
jgi:hypothetical protein